MIITAHTIVTGDGKTVLRDSGVYLEGGKVAAIGPVAELKAKYPKAEVTDYGNATILPGLIDLHTHVGAAYSPDPLLNSDDTIQMRALNNVQTALFSGVTTIRDCGCPENVTHRIRMAANKGLVRAPRIVTSGAAICSTGGHGWEGNITIEVDGIENLRAAIRKLIRDGADWIKLMTSHRSDVCQYTQEELDAVADEAHRWGRKVAVHTSRHPSLQMVIDAGLDTIEHGCDLTLEQILQMKEKGIAWVPTLYVHRITIDELNEKVAANGVESLNERELETYLIYGPANERYETYFKQFAETGVLIASGTDMMNQHLPITPVDKEVALMVRYGMDPVWAIGAGTLNCAKVLGMEDELGELAPGKAADILVVTGDASKNIEALSDIEQVYLSGKLVRREI